MAKRGRPRKPKPRGRPRKKRARGRPRKGRSKVVFVHGHKRSKPRRKVGDSGGRWGRRPGWGKGY